MVKDSLVEIYGANDEKSVTIADDYLQGWLELREDESGTIFLFDGSIHVHRNEALRSFIPAASQGFRNFLIRPRMKEHNGVLGCLRMGGIGIGWCHTRKSVRIPEYFSKERVGRLVLNFENCHKKYEVEGGDKN